MKKKALSLLLALTMLLGIVAIPVAAEEVSALVGGVEVPEDAAAEDARAASPSDITYTGNIEINYVAGTAKMVPNLPRGVTAKVQVQGGTVTPIPLPVTGNKLDALYEALAADLRVAPGVPSGPTSKNLVVTLTKSGSLDTPLAPVPIMQQLVKPAADDPSVALVYDVLTETVKKGTAADLTGYQAIIAAKEPAGTWPAKTTIKADAAGILKVPAPAKDSKLFVRIAPTESAPGSQVTEIAIKGRPVAPKAAELVGLIDFHTTPDVVTFSGQTYPTAANATPIADTSVLEFRVKPAKADMPNDGKGVFAFQAIPASGSDLNLMTPRATEGETAGYGGGVGYTGAKAVALEIRKKADPVTGTPASKPVAFSIPKQGAAPAGKLTAPSYTLSNLQSAKTGVQYLLIKSNSDKAAGLAEVNKIKDSDGLWIDVPDKVDWLNADGTLKPEYAKNFNVDLESAFDTFYASAEDKNAGVDVWIRFKSRQVVSVKSGKTVTTSTFRSVPKKLGTLKQRAISPQDLIWEVSETGVASGKIRVDKNAAKPVYLGNKYEYSLNGMNWKKATNNEILFWLLPVTGTQKVYLRLAATAKDPASEATILTFDTEKLADQEYLVPSRT